MRATSPCVVVHVEASGANSTAVGNRQSELLRVAVVSSVRITREAVAAILENDGYCRVVGTHGELKLPALTMGSPQVVVVDGSSVVVKPENLFVPRSVRIAVFGLRREVGDAIMTWISAGVRVCLDADEPLARLVPAVAATARGDVLCAPRIVEQIITEFPRIARPGDNKRLGELTAREHEVAELIGQGLTNTQIAGVLDVSHSTVKNHVQSILKRLGTHRRTEIKWYLE